jgi:hypothetical protein
MVPLPDGFALESVMLNALDPATSTVGSEKLPNRPEAGSNAETISLPASASGMPS